MKLNIDHIDVAYGRTQVLFDVSLEVPEHSIVCLMGRNGVGKTTLLNALTGLLPFRSGDAIFGGTSLGGLAPHRRSLLGIGYVPQGHSVFPRLTTLENLLVIQERGKGTGIRGIGRRKEAVDSSALDEALDLFPALTTLLGKPAGLLSGGQAKQLAIARALLGRPSLLILDEPTEGIQPSIIGEIEDAIARLHGQSGISILLVEQYVEFAMRLADHYTVLDGGRVISQGAADIRDLNKFSELLAI
ncbi:MAG: ATP-binding cassette domain-containing protein [Acidimicrobiales bacterium]